MNHTRQVRDFIVTTFLFGDDSTLQDEVSFLENGIIDSTGMLELILFLEQTFNIKVKPEEMLPENLDSVNRVTQFVARKLAAPAA